ncbi:MAG TPA: class I SAM-dependent methyltransferase [Pyrinomonadaceae bacterium]|nr:class I SAM-dependent methyltransferase [Pyrinomonadaceae bacterium]
MSEASLFEFKDICCPVCGGDAPIFLGWRGGEAHQNGVGEKTAIVRCKECSHQYPNPMPFPKANLEEIYVDADEYFRGHNVEEKKQIGLGLMQEFEQKLGKRGKFLDVGCGAGELLWAAKTSGWDAEGIDPSKEFIEIGRERLGVEGRATTLEDAKFPDNHFDAIAMSGIIEHLYNPFETLQEIHRVLRPNGLFWFDAPNEDGLYMQFGNLYMRLQRKNWVVVMAPTFPPYHVQGFNPKSLRKLLKRAMFELKEMELIGEVCEQQGSESLRKKVEFKAAKAINKIGKMLNKGSYMSIWAKKTR